MASPTRWTWVWVHSGSWWWAWRPSVLQFIGSQRVGHDWATELNWTSAVVLLILFLFHSLYHHCSASILMVLDLRVLVHMLISFRNNNRLHHWLFLLLCTPLLLPDISPLSTIFFTIIFHFLSVCFRFLYVLLHNMGALISDLYQAFLFKG